MIYTLKDIEEAWGNEPRCWPDFWPGCYKCTIFWLISELKKSHQAHDAEGEGWLKIYNGQESKIERLNKQIRDHMADRYQSLTCLAKGCNKEVHPFCLHHDWGDR